MMATPRIVLGQPHRDDDRPGILVQTPYSEEFVEELKSLPRRDRAWDSEEKVWWVAEAHRDRVQELVIHHFGAVEVVDEDGACETISPQARTRQERLF